MLEINWLATRDTPFSLRFKTHKKLDGSTGLFEFFFMAILRLMAPNIGDKVFDSEGTLFQRLGITLLQDGIGITSITLIDETYRSK